MGKFFNWVKRSVVRKVITLVIAVGLIRLLISNLAYVAIASLIVAFLIFSNKANTTKNP